MCEIDLDISSRGKTLKGVVVLLILIFNPLTIVKAKAGHEGPWSCAVFDVITLSDHDGRCP